MEKKDEPKAGQVAALPLLLNHSAAEVYVSEIVRADVEWGGTVKLTFCSYHVSGDGKETSRSVNLRLAMPGPALQHMTNFLNGWMKNLQAITTPPPPGTVPH